MPAKLQYFVEEPYVYGWLGIFLTFLYLTYNPVLAGTFLAMIFAVMAMHFAFNPKITFNPIKGNTGVSFLYGAGAFLVFTALSVVMLTIFQQLLKIDPTLNSVWSVTSASIFGKLISSTAPVLAESRILTVIVFGIMIAFVETMLIVRSMESLSFIGGISLELRNLKLWLVFAVISSGFVWLHIQAKGVTETAPLVLVFIFAMITCAMAVKSKEAESAVYFHQINNTNSIIRTVFFGAK